MKTLLLVLLLPAAIASLVSANSYQGIRYATTEGRVYEHLTGEFAVAASTISYSTYTAKMNGVGGVVTAQKVVISSGAVNSIVESMCIAGAFAALPTTGYARGCLLYLTTDPTKIYISTQTVVSTHSWLAK